MMDVHTVRAEIKGWERDFRQKHGRDPSVDEIKAQPAIAAKYKLYKSLSKAASSSLPPKKAPVKVDAPLLTTNPFSPSKKRPAAPLVLARPNPFKTPTKPKTRPTRRDASPDSFLAHTSQPRELSPDPFPLIQPLTKQPDPPAVSSAVSRARKRLRGEPVSPSPVKEKRARVLHPVPSHSGLSPDRDPDPNHSFLDNTPVKPPPGRKSFKLLFDELPPAEQSRPRAPPTRTQSRRDKPTHPDVFSTRSQSILRTVSPTSDESKPVASSSGLQKRPAVPRAPVPRKNDLHSEIAPSKGYPTRPALPNSAKRPRPPADDPEEHVGHSPSPSIPRNTFLNLPLLPHRYDPKGKGKAKAKATFSRKKARVLQEATGADEDDEDEDTEDEPRVKVVEHAWHRRPSPDADTDGDSDEWRPRPDAQPEAVPAASLETLSIDLPDELRRVLALDPDAVRADAQKEARVVRGLLYGRRDHYDAQRGGEVWGVGEVGEEALGDREDRGGAGEEEEDEWEGEGVPWEVGEL
ncbi:DNA replication and checkpoint protein-domain-containing protein [Sparassis latifolia]